MKFSLLPKEEAWTLFCRKAFSKLEDSSYQIERTRLIRLWIAEGFVENRGPETMLPDVAACYLKELVDRSLLQVVKRNEYGRPKRFQMHDLVREISLTISEKEKFATTWECPTSGSIDDGSRRVSIQIDNNLMQVARSSARFRSIIMFVEEVSLSWFRDCYPCFRLLRVLCLRNCHMQQVPENVSGLFNLHYLDLGYTKLKEIPRSIGKLSNLQTLYLKGQILELPSDMTMLKKLHHLLIDVGRFGSSSSNKICQLELLQTFKNIEATSSLVKKPGCLTRMRSLGIRKVLVSYNKDFWTSINKMSSLNSLSVTTADCDRDVLDLEHLNSLPHLEKLMLSGKLEKGAIPPAFGHFPKLKCLRLCFSSLHEDPLALFLVMFQNLGHLSLYRCYEGTRLTFRASWFPKIRHLYLSSMSLLREVVIEVVP